MEFKKNFLWGAATASYQVEGAAFEDGKGASTWDKFCQNKPEAVKFRHNGNSACDHYHRYMEDVAIMKELGLKSYRFSLSWPRIMPTGIKEINKKGLDFYDRLIDELLKNDIIPFITLFHWNYPHELYLRGGFLNPDIADWFADFTKIVVKRYSDRVKYWATLNEPQSFILRGHYYGTHAPGVKLGLGDILQSTHNLLLAHGKAVQTIRKYAKKPCEVSFAPVGKISIPQTNTEDDIEAARLSMFSIYDRDLWSNSWWMDPVMLGKYPEDGLKIFEEFMPEIKTDDLKIINQPLDFFGVNIYSGKTVNMGKDNKPEEVENEIGFPKTAFDWPVTPKALFWGSKFLYERYGKPIIITENGLSNIDWISMDGKIHDPQRIDFMHRYLTELLKASEHGIDIRGYFCWSLLDNFEWADGFNERFGLVYIDYATQKRTIKDSGYWYKKIIESNGALLNQN